MWNKFITDRKNPYGWLLERDSPTIFLYFFINLNNPPILRFKYFWIWFRIGRPIYNLITSLEGVECSFTLINGYTVWASLEVKKKSEEMWSTKFLKKLNFFWLSLLLSSLRIKKNKKNGKLNSLALRRLIKFLKSQRSKKSAQPSWHTNGWKCLKKKIS